MATIAAKHAVHPNQVTGWKRQGREGLQEVFASGTNRREADHPAERDSAPGGVRHRELTLRPRGTC